MNKARGKRIKEYKDLLRKRKEVEPNLLKIPGVIGVSIGLKVRNGIPTKDIGLRVYIEKKKPLTEIPAAEQIPPKINQIITDIEEFDQKVNASSGNNIDTKRYRPLCGGIAIRSSGNPRGGGTLGCIVQDKVNKSIYLLTNYHVLRKRGEKKGHQVAQPEFCCDSFCCRCGEIARLERWADIETDNVDCAIATLNEKHKDWWVNEILELGSIGIKDPNLSDEDVLLPGESVFKRGIGTGLTEGLVVDPETPTVSVEYSIDGVPNKIDFTGQILVYPKSPDKPFSSKSDSGAVVLNHLNQVIGLHFADNETRDGNGMITHKATKSYANPIRHVTEKLNITILNSGSFNNSLPLQSTINLPSFKRVDILGEVVAKLETHSDGHEIIHLFRKHQIQIMDLINHNREVKATWNRHNGPAFVAHLMEKEKHPQHAIPDQINGISLKRLLLKMSVVLEKHGTPDLAADIDQYSIKTLKVLEFLRHSFN